MVFKSDRTAVELLDDRSQNARVHFVESERVDVEQRERLVGDRLRDRRRFPSPAR